MILLGNGSNSPKGKLAGRHRRVGLSLTFAAGGRSGESWGLKSARMLIAYLEKVRVSSPGTLSVAKPGPKSPTILSNGVGSTFQSPDKFRLWSEARGARADRVR